MSNSANSTAIQDKPLAGVPGPISLDHPIESAESISPADVVGTALGSSPPLQEEAKKKPLSPHVPTFHHLNGLSEKGEPDADNDSEAETLISSPVKKREALRKANDPDTKHASHEHREDEDKQNTPDDIPPVDKSGSEVGQDCKNSEGSIKDIRADEDVQNGEESDNLSDVLSVQSSFASAKNIHGSLSVGSDAGGNDNESARSEEDEDPSEVDVIERNGDDDGDGDVVNPRKRKHRESYIHASMEPPRRRRRASDEGNTHNGSGENGDSSSPQLRRQHRRTTSTQSNWTDANRSANGNNAAGPVPGRQRRAATHFPVRDVIATRNNWDSDTSSEASHQHHLNRLTRNINRSVSTPGRPMGRDHKRHVNKYGFTRLAEACEIGDLDLVKEWRQKDPEQLEQREFAGNTPLQVASLNGFPEIVSYLLAEKCNPHTANTDQDTPLIDAVENGHIEVVRLLLEAGVNPLRQNLKGQQALDLVSEDNENSQDMRATLRDAIEEWRRNDKGQQQQKEGEPTKRPGPSKELHFLAYTPSNLLRLAGENDKTGIAELLQSQVQVNNEIVAAAAKTGDTFTVSMLLAELKPKDARKKPELPLLAVIGTSHFEMVKYLTGADGFNPVWRSRSNSMTWHELAENRQGPNWRQEKDLLKQLYDERVKTDRLSSSPISRRENGKRRRTPLIQEESDLEMDDLDSNEQARSRRRLVSKKVMRAASSKRRSFSSSDTDGDHVESMDSSKLNSPDNNTLRPPPPRKVGRPRKASTSSHLSEPQPKRSRSSSMREGPPAFDSPRNTRLSARPEESSRVQDEQKIKLEESERQRTEAEAEAKAKLEAEAEATQKAELEARIKSEWLLEEQRKAAEEKEKADMEARRKEAERKAEEIRLQYQQQIAQERRLKEEKQIQALPSALRHVLGLTSAAKVEKQKYIQRHFLPVQVVKRSDLGSMAEGEAGAEDPWMLSYQAAAILTNAGAAALLGLPADPMAKHSAMSGVATLATTQEQRRAMLPCLQSSSLVHTSLPDEQAGTPTDDLAAELAMAEKTRLQMAEDRSKFLSMSTLHWIRFSDFRLAATAAEGAARDYPHLAGLELNARFDCCLDSTLFFAEQPEAADTCRRLANGVKAEDVGDVKTAVKGLRRRCDQGLVTRGGPGITTFTIVHD